MIGTLNPCFRALRAASKFRSEEHTSELQSRVDLVCRLLLEKKKNIDLPLSYWIAFSKWRWKFIVEAVVALPLVLPPTVLDLYVLMEMRPRSSLRSFGIVFTV